MGKNKRLFLFDDQVKDNLALTLAPAMFIGTLWESVGWWAYANEIAPIITWGENPIWFVLLFLVLPVWSIAYFSVTHWLLHRGPAYTHVHSWHHKNVNVGPWSGLAMHPLEHVVLCADVLLFLLLPAHPVHFLFAMMHHSLGAPMSHTGHDALRLPGGYRFELGDFFHQLHHRLIECNYGGPESPLDTAINAWHDGTGEGEQATAARRRRSGLADLWAIWRRKQRRRRENRRIRLHTPAPLRIHPERKPGLHFPDGGRISPSRATSETPRRTRSALSEPVGGPRRARR